MNDHSVSELGLSPEFLAVRERLNTPELIQKFLDEEIEYGYPERSVEDGLRVGKMECTTGALLAYACLKYHGYETYLVELLPREKDKSEWKNKEKPEYIDEEHIVCVYKNKENDNWNTIGMSKFYGLRDKHGLPGTHESPDKEAIAHAYWEDFYDLEEGRFSLQSISEPYSDPYQMKWLNDQATVMHITRDLHDLPHTNVIDPNLKIKYISPADYWTKVRWEEVVDILLETDISSRLWDAPEAPEELKRLKRLRSSN